MRKKIFTKGVSVALTAATVISMTPQAAFAVTGAQVAKDGEYSADTTVYTDEAESWNDYSLNVAFTVSDGVFSNIEITPGDAGEIDGEPVSNTAYLKKVKKAYANLIGQSATEDTVNSWDTVTGATVTTTAVKDCILTALANAEEAESETVDKTELAAAIKDAEEKVESDYTAESWKTFKKALEEAVTVNENESATAEEVSSALSALNEASEGLEKSTAFTETTYVYMNIPYDKFYEAEVNNDVAVDAYTSATKSKPRSWGLSAGSYHSDASAESINGAVYAVEVPAGTDLSAYTQVTDESSLDITVTSRGQESTTTLTGSQVLFESPDYSYYVIGTEAPASYKVLTVAEDGSFSFGKATGEAETKGATAELNTDSKYGDYELDLDISKTDIGYTDEETAEVNAVTINTTDGTSYGLRTMENIWRVNELAWCTGFTSEVHGSPTSSAHYESMMGKTIDSVTYYTSKGIYTFDIEDTYVPKKVSAEEASLRVADGKVAEGQTTVEATLPDGYTAEYAVSGLADAEVKDGLLTYSKTAVPGKYTLTATDSSKTYAKLSASFILSTDTLPAKYDEESKSLIAAESADATEFTQYVKGISSVSVNGKAYAASGRGSTTIINSDGSLKTDAAPIANAGKYELTVSVTGYPDLTFTYEKKAEKEYVYAYAALSYSEYWSGEDVYANTDTSSSDSQDTNGEYDLGGFDTVTRATTNHGLHRGSFQQNAVIYDTEGNTYNVSSWTGKNTIALTDGSTIGFAGGTITLADGSTKTMDHYEILGIKYVPVKVAKADYEAFKEAYTVVENGESLAGGYSEGLLSSYSGLVAAVDENTNGLKEATKNEDGTFSFGARKSGSGSGIEGAELQTIDVTPVVQSESSFGDFIRVDIKKEATPNYGELGAKMQTVVWNYYGDGDTVLASYGTKFAADNWMHKSMGIQLGLTDSARCKLPSGTDGTGKWTVTIYALGYADTTMEFNITADDIHTASPVSDTSKLEEAIKAAKALNQDDYTAESWSASGIETELKEAEDQHKLAASKKTSQEAVDEAATHLNAAISELVPVISEKNGFNKIDDEWVYYQDGKATTITDVVNGKIDGVSGWYNVVDGKLAKGVTVAHNNAGWWYIDENGKVDFSYTGLAANKYGTWYLEKGKVNFSKTDVLKIGNSWYNISGGKLVTGPTLGKNSAGWWYIDKNGKVDFGVTTLIQYNKVWYYVENGKLNWNYTGLYKHEGNWYYVEGGKLTWNYTGLCKYNGGWYYVQNSKLNWNYTGLCKHNGSWYYVQSGKLNWNYTGLVKHYGSWYYVQKGVLNWNYTGLVSHYGNWYYVEKGVLNWNYTGLCQYNGGWYYVENGKINWNYTGFVKNAYGTWYVQKGSIHFSYSGTVNGKKVVNGKVQ